MATPAPFDWKSLIDPAVALGFKAVGDKVAPGADLQNAQNSRANLAENQRQFNIQNQLAQQRLGQSNQIRQNIMPGMYTQLGFTPQQGQRMTQDYAAKYPAQPAGSSASFGGGTATPNYSPALQPKAPGLGSQIGKTALGLGTSALAIPGAAGALGGLIGGFGGTTALGGGATLTSAGTGLLGALGTTGAATLGIGAAAALGAIMWRKSQAHPEANQWVQGEQNPFDKSMAAIDQRGLPPDQAKAAKQENAQRYLNELQKFASQGGDKLQVARQAADTFRQWYGDPAQYGVQLGF